MSKKFAPNINDPLSISIVGSEVEDSLFGSIGDEIGVGIGLFGSKFSLNPLANGVFDRLENLVLNWDTPLLNLFDKGLGG